MSFNNSSSSPTGRDMSGPWRRKDSHSPASSPSRTFDKVSASTPCLTFRDMHLGDFFWLPKRDEIPVDSLPKPLNRNAGMFGHPVVIVNINKDENIVSFRSVTTSKGKDNETGRKDRMQTRVCIEPQRGYTEVEKSELSNEHQLDRTYRFHGNSGDLRKPSEVLITEGLIFKIEPHILQPLAWTKKRVHLDADSTKRLVLECPKVYGPASPRRDSSSSSSSNSSSPSPSPSPAERRPLALMSVNVPSPATRSKATSKARPCDGPGNWRRTV